MVTASINKMLEAVKEEGLLIKEVMHNNIVEFQNTGCLKSYDKAMRGVYFYSLRLARRLSKTYPSLPILDLAAEGMIGAVRGIQKYDPKLREEGNLHPISYIYHWVQNYQYLYIYRNITQKRLFTNSYIKMFMNAIIRHGGLLAFNVDYEEIFKETQHALDKKIDSKEIRQVIFANVVDHIKGASSVFNEKTHSPPDTATEERFINRIDTRNKTQDMITKYLTKNAKNTKFNIIKIEEDLIRKRLCAEKPESLESLGAKYGVSKERIRQREAELIVKLRDFITKNCQDLVEDYT